MIRCREPTCCGPVEQPRTGPRRDFCSRDCKDVYHNRVKTRAAAIYADLYAWRLHRGRKGTPGERKLGDVANAVQNWITEDREMRERARQEKTA